MATNNTIAQRLQGALVAGGFVGRGSVARLARETGILDNTLRSYLSDRYEPGPKNLVKLSDATGVDLRWLITGEKR